MWSRIWSACACCSRTSKRTTIIIATTKHTLAHTHTTTNIYVIQHVFNSQNSNKISTHNVCDSLTPECTQAHTHTHTNILTAQNFNAFHIAYTLYFHIYKNKLTRREKKRVKNGINRPRIFLHLLFFFK